MVPGLLSRSADSFSCMNDGWLFFNAIEAAVLPCLHFSDANKLGHVVTVGAYFVFLPRRSKRQKWNENVLN